MEQLHRLLRRQLKKHLGSVSIPDQWHGFINAVNDAYHQSDTDRGMLEHSLDLSSKELLRANAEMLAILQAFPDLFLRLDFNGNILDCRGGHADRLYLPPEKLIGKNIQATPMKIISNRFHQVAASLRETKQMGHLEYSRSTGKDELFYEARLLPIFEDQIILVARNITEQKRAETKLKQQAQVIDQIHDSVIISDLKGFIILWNKASETFFGYKREEALKRHISFIFSEKDYAFLQDDIVPPLRDRGRHELDVRLLKKSGEIFPAHLSLSLIHDFAGNLTGTVGYTVDISERVLAQEEREKLILNLQEALAEVKTLKGIIPICSSCKKIRDDKGSWKQIEAYICAHSEAEFSHGICQECAKKLYPDLVDDNGNIE